jgi:hypothetical protein
VVHRQSNFFVRPSDYFTTPNPLQNVDASESLDSSEIPYAKTPNYSFTKIKRKSTTVHKASGFAPLKPGVDVEEGMKSISELTRLVANKETEFPK